ncbi:exported hypothetical protein [Candidatus Zixiibacteriota bacterium]|nr:exported hypothetical protein [candidate division Zixibacteria bacterium]
MTGKLIIATAIIILVPLSLLAEQPQLQENNRSEAAVSDTQFTAIDLGQITLVKKSDAYLFPASPSAYMPGVEPSPFILWRNFVTSESGFIIMTLDYRTGAQMGDRLNFDFIKGSEPVGIRWCHNFSAVAKSIMGVDPVPWIVFRDYKLFTVPISFNSDGTPVAGAQAVLTPSVNVATYGHATCLTELPGSEFPDGKPRLFVGSDLGYMIVLINTLVAGIVVSDILPVSTVPIFAIRPIPQFGYISLGVLTENTIKGIRYQPGTGDLAQSGTYTVEYTLRDPRQIFFSNYDTFGADDAPLADSLASLRIVICDGSAELSLADISPRLSGDMTLKPIIDRQENQVSAVATGSLLALQADGSSVSFDPYYSETGGSSGCSVNITDGLPDECTFICGDANRNGIVNILDVSFIISYLYKHGPVPVPLPSADVNHSGGVNILDVSYLINFLYKHGLPLNCP